MNLKKCMSILILTSFFFTGCTRDKGREVIVADEITKQKTITKVQNDVNEIINKDYEYILKNMGTPYCTTYYISSNGNDYDINELENYNEISHKTLIYPKYTSDNQLEGSALYLEVKDNSVVEVQTYEFSDYDVESEFEELGSNINFIVDQYNEKANLDLEKIKSLHLDEYVDKHVNKLYSKLRADSANFEAYDRNRTKKIKGYLLNDENSEVSKVLTVYEKEDRIKSIDITNVANTMDTIKKYLNEN